MKNLFFPRRSSSELIELLNVNIPKQKVTLEEVESQRGPKELDAREALLILKSWSGQ